MRAAIVTESCFGNTASLGQTIAHCLRAEGLDVELHAVDSAPARIDADIVIIGAPTHNRGLSSPGTRKQAVARGARPGAGVREWIEGGLEIEGRIIAFATTSGGPFAGSAGAAIVKLLKRAGLGAERGPDFTVSDIPGPLKEGEDERARQWARSLTGSLN